MNDKISTINIAELHLFRDNPFKVRKDEAFDELVESISQDGIYDPLIISPDKENSGYVIISGQRRYEAAKAAGLEKVPAVINELDKDELIIAVVDNNICSRNTLPSEKAHAYKMKLEAMKRQGRRTDLTLSQNGKRLNSYEEVAELTGDSRNKIHRYIRLTELLPEILNLVDEGRIGISPATELSYLPSEVQREIYSYYENDEVTPTVYQAQRIRKKYNEGTLTEGAIHEIMSELKPNQKEAVRIPSEKVQKYFKTYKDPKFVADFIDKAIKFYAEHLERERKHSRREDAR